MCFSSAWPQIARREQGGDLQHLLWPGAGPPAEGLQPGGFRGDGPLAHPRVPRSVARLAALCQWRRLALLRPAGHPQRVHLPVHGALSLRAVERHRRDHHAVPARRPDVYDEHTPKAAPKGRICLCNVMFIYIYMLIHFFRAGQG